MTSIRLHPKHGVNPTIPVCFWCQKSKNEVALLGSAYKGEAPMSGLVLDYEPCDGCKADMSRGIALIEVNPRDTRSLTQRQRSRLGAFVEYEPTGRWVVMSEDWVTRQVTPDKLRDTLLTARKGFIGKDLMDIIQEEHKKALEAEEGDKS